MQHPAALRAHANFPEYGRVADGRAVRMRHLGGPSVRPVVVLSHEAVQVTGDGTALVPFQLAWNPNVVDAPEPTEPL